MHDMTGKDCKLDWIRTTLLTLDNTLDFQVVNFFIGLNSEIFETLDIGRQDILDIFLEIAFMEC